jgi:hypothetical protein
LNWATITSSSISSSSSSSSGAAGATDGRRPGPGRAASARGLGVLGAAGGGWRLERRRRRLVGRERGRRAWRNSLGPLPAASEAAEAASFFDFTRTRSRLQQRERRSERSAEPLLTQRPGSPARRLASTDVAMRCLTTGSRSFLTHSSSGDPLA